MLLCIRKIHLVCLGGCFSGCQCLRLVLIIQQSLDCWIHLIVFLFFTHHLVCVKIYRFVSLVYSCLLMFLVLWYVLHHVSIYGGVSTISWHTSLWFIIRNLPSINPCCARRLFFTLLFATCSNQFRSSLFPKCCAIIGSANIKISFHSLPQP